MVNYLGDWDWLIILDACRYDFFVKNWKIGKTKPVISLDSCTIGVLRLMPKIPNSIVITGHPFLFSWKRKFDEVVDAGWDDKLMTTPPWMMVDYVLRNHDKIVKYKKRILWFLQPHHPFIGETKLNVAIFEDKRWGRMPPMWRQVQMYKQAFKEGFLWKAYEDNLKLALKEVKRLLQYIRGKIVITSDHGDGLGKPLRPEDKPVFSHPCGRKEWELRLIPYCEIIIK